MEMSGPAASLGRNPGYLLNRTLGRPESWSGWFGEEGKLLLMPKIEPQIIQCVA
jgi:hypothetical protein